MVPRTLVFIRKHHLLGVAHQSHTLPCTDTHNSVGLKVTSLKYRGTSTAALDHEDGPIQVPHNLRHTKRVRREDEIGLDDQPSLSPSLTQQLDAAAEKKLQDTVSPTTGFSQMSTQTRQDQLAKHMLQKMIIPSTPASDIVPTQVRANDLQTLIADDEQDTQLMRPEISQADLVRLARTQSGTYYPNPSMRQMNNGNGSHGSSNIIGLDINNCDDNAESDVLCQCGWKGKPANERMLRCSFCDKLQHPVCYGFLHGEDPSIPAVHACYQCLLDPVTEGRALRELGTLAMLRQALKVIVEKGYPGRVREFSALLRELNLPVLIAIVSRHTKNRTCGDELGFVLIRLTHFNYFFSTFVLS